VSAGPSAGDIVTIDCVELDQEGAAIGGDPVPIHVAGALPGERVAATITHVSSHQPRAWARLERIVRASPDRRAPACRAYGACGGCVLQHFAYQGQLDWKTARVRRIVAEQPELAATPVAICVPSPRTLGYRNRSKLVCARDPQGGLVLGAFAPRSHRVVDLVGGCRIAEPPLDDVALALRAILDAHAVVPYDERTYAGDLRHVVLRVNQGGQVLATLVSARREWAAAAAVAAALCQARPEIAGVVQNVNPSRGNVIYGADEVTLAGAPRLEDRIGGVRLRLSSGSFFQANREVAAQAYQAIADAAGLTGAERVVDAYAGVGGIALTLAPAAREVIGIEEHAAAVEDATASAALNRADNARFVAGDVARRLSEIGAAEMVILNPPRKGCAPAVLDQVVRLAPRRIAYLSCAPVTLARDLAHLARRGYWPSSLTPFDMMPHTPHVEVLAVIEPARRGRSSQGGSARRR
jgi:23S rRNA (uracil1939-C5)-methyltransferase